MGKCEDVRDGKCEDVRDGKMRMQRMGKCHDERGWENVRIQGDEKMGDAK